MNYAQQEEIRQKYRLINRGLYTLRNIMQEMMLGHATGDPFLDGNEEARGKILVLITRASELAHKDEIEALVAEYGPEARLVLG